MCVLNGWGHFDGPNYGLDGPNYNLGGPNYGLDGPKYGLQMTCRLTN